jgi:hypothetical protein
MAAAAAAAAAEKVTWKYVSITAIQAESVEILFSRRRFAEKVKQERKSSLVSRFCR